MASVVWRLLLLLPLLLPGKVTQLLIRKSKGHKVRQPRPLLDLGRKGSPHGLEPAEPVVGTQASLGGAGWQGLQGTVGTPPLEPHGTPSQWTYQDA